MVIRKISKHVPKTPRTFKVGWNRTANKRPQRWVTGASIKIYTKDKITLNTFRKIRKQLIKKTKEFEPRVVVVKHSIWPRSYGFEYMIHLVEEEKK